MLTDSLQVEMMLWLPWKDWKIWEKKPKIFETNKELKGVTKSCLSNMLGDDLLLGTVEENEITTQAVFSMWAKKDINTKFLFNEVYQGKSKTWHYYYFLIYILETLSTTSNQQIWKDHRWVVSTYTA